MFFFSRDSNEVNIQSTIKIICSYAFSHSKLTRIMIPAHATKICIGAFENCSELSRVEFEPNSELRIIKKFTLAHSKIVCILFPAHITQIDKNAFKDCVQLQIVEIASY